MAISCQLSEEGAKELEFGVFDKEAIVSEL